MDEVLENMPCMPAVLVPHDIYHEDWIRLMTVRSLSSNAESRSGRMLTLTAHAGSQHGVVGHHAHAAVPNG